MNRAPRIRLRRQFEDGTRIDAVVWDVPVSEAYQHGLSYRLWFGTSTQTRVLYDIHHGKPYHKHIRGVESEYRFKDVEANR